jgi:hypothetical protein
MVPLGAEPRWRTWPRLTPTAASEMGLRALTAWRNQRFGLVCSPHDLCTPIWWERVGCEHVRHRLETLVASFEVATGQVLVPSVGPPRAEEVFVRHMERTIALDPNAAWVLIVDRLNTHQEAT